jgi:hypothetical protein
VHRSRPPVFAIFAAVAACSTRHDPDANEILSHDSTLVATLEVRQKPRQQPLPEGCGAVTVTARPAAANRELAGELAQQAYDAELLGNMQQARSLLIRASSLDGTDKSAAYHLGRTSEVLGDRTGAMTAYCRYLTLAPTAAESAEARQRVAELSQAGTRVAAAGGVSFNVPAARHVAMATPRRATRPQPTVERRVAIRPVVEHSTRVASTGRGTQSASAMMGADGSATRGDGVSASPDGNGRVDGTADGVDGVSTAEQAPSVEQPATASRSASRGPTAAQSVGIGAVAGAIIGAATGHSMKSAVIGAAAGGILGTVVGGMSRPTSRSVRPWSPATQGAASSRTARLPYRYRPAA